MFQRAPFGCQIITKWSPEAHFNRRRRLWESPRGLLHACLEASWRRLEGSWNLLGGILRALGASLKALGGHGRRLEGSWRHLEGAWSPLGGVLRDLGAVLEASWFLARSLMPDH